MCQPVVFFWGEKSAKGELVFCKGKILLQMPIEKKKKNRQIATENLFCCKGCPQIHAYWLNVYDFRGKESPAKLESAYDACKSGSMTEFERENTVVGLPWSVGWLNIVKHVETPLDKKFIELITLV